MSDTTSEREPGVEGYEGLSPAEAWAQVCGATGVQARVQKSGSEFGWQDFAMLAEAAIGMALHERQQATDALAALRSENARLAALLEAERIEHRRTREWADAERVVRHDVQDRSRTAERSLTIAEQCVERAEHSLAVVTGERDRLREALANVDRIASRGDVNVQPLLVPIRDVCRRALLTTPDSREEASDG